MVVPTVRLLNGSNLPVVGLGTWQSTDEKELETALDAALENGYRHIDTAFAYGNENVIGNVLQKWFKDGKLKREDIFVTTKLPLQGIRPDGVEPFIKKSLESLQLDYLDLYLIHFAVGTDPSDENLTSASTIPTDHLAIWKKMEEQVDAGRTKAIGLSNFSIGQIDKIVKNARIKPASLQIEVHVFLQQNELVKFAQDNGIVVVAYSPLANPNANTFFSTALGLPPRDLPIFSTNATIKSIADKHKKSSAQVVLKFLLQRNLVIIPKSVSVNRIKENIDLFDFTLDEKDVAALRGLEIGERARVCDFRFNPALPLHPEFPFPKY